jgi:hypothetical protein
MLCKETQKPNKNEKRSKNKKSTVTKSLVIKPHLLPRKVYLPVVNCKTPKKLVFHHYKLTHSPPKNNRVTRLLARSINTLAAFPFTYYFLLIKLSNHPTIRVLPKIPM